MKPGQLKFRYELQEDDPHLIGEIVESTGFFRDSEVAIAMELATEQINHPRPDGYHFIFAEINGRMTGYSCYGPVPGTVGCFDLYWIATHSKFQGSGIGGQILNETLKLVRKRQGRLLIAETATKALYAPTRAFYEKHGFLQEALIRDFYEPGDGKAMFVFRFE
ncbi:MAG: GNAT family N-acetyltransferase [Bacteroidales bacterium]